MSDAALISLFQNIGLTEQKAKESAKNKKLAPALETSITEAGFATTGCEKDIGALLYALASTVTKDALPHLPYIAKQISNGKLKTVDQVSAAIKFVESAKGEIDTKAFDEATGVGIVVTPAQISAEVAAYFTANRDSLVEGRYRLLGPTLANVRKLPSLRWADGGSVKNEVEKQFTELVGPKDERDQPAKGKKKEAASAAGAGAARTATANKPANDVPNMFFEGELAKLHKPGGNKQIKEELMVEHLKATGGKVVTRFPPEPNGFLHIGHAKAINVNFGYAKAHNGVCYLRYDDTNPEAEEERYFVSILETVRWLGFEPWKITYSSDYFQELYDLAIDLIKRDKAYVCHCTGEEIHKNRGGDEGGPRIACSHRTRPIEESLIEFIKMKEGRYSEGQATLRMKMNLEDGNPQFWDLIAYRVLYTPHHRTGSDWCIYPTYDYTHCLCDSFENITHSLCTLEFRQSRESYYWLVDALEIYKPVQWEYGRLNVTNTVMSKRKVLKLVNEKFVNAWDDPRLFTLVALRRRGVPPEAINNFVRELGVTMASATIDVARLDNHVREYLDRHSPRLMVILEPILVTLENLPEDHVEELTIPNKPRDPAMGEHVVPFTKHLYIDASDFREQDSADYFRLAPGKTVGLLYVKHPITCTRVVKDPVTGKVTELVCRYENKDEAVKPKTYIHWIALSPRHASPVRLDEVRVYGSLFKHSNPLDKTLVPGGWLSDIDPDSLHVTTGALAEVGVWDQLAKWIEATGAKEPESMRWQFVRIGYYCMDLDSEIKVEPGKKVVPQEVVKRFVVNRTVTLKEDTKKEEDKDKKGEARDPRKK
ncbi:tRNA synthetases class I, catalytic domain-containing protein [Jimgerdemannia flammicorona]|uniref:glutamine--tRNA ligase n=1 Tax=Jimgerdemannia flammicorona TaxID=994334 RepID=A0A433DEU4_9FUNG|nr:tRNA synthetases class I, catalytic domain-containing protein [Jimgerdemannia flammicorona]